MNTSKIIITMVIILFLGKNCLLFGMDPKQQLNENLLNAVNTDSFYWVKYYLWRGADPLARSGQAAHGTYVTPLSVALVRNNDAIINAMLDNIDPKQLQKGHVVQLLDHDKFDALRALVKKGLRPIQLEWGFLEYLSTIERTDITARGKDAMEALHASQAFKGKKFNPDIIKLAEELDLNIYNLKEKMPAEASAAVKQYFSKLLSKQFAGEAFKVSDPDSYIASLPIDVIALTLQNVMTRQLTKQERDLFGLIFSARAKRRQGKELTNEELKAWRFGAEAFAHLSEVTKKASSSTAAAAAAAALPPSTPKP